MMSTKKNTNNHEDENSNVDSTIKKPSIPVFDQHYLDMFENPEETAAPEVPKLEVVGATTMAYDAAEVDAFLDLVFHTTVPTDNILTFNAKTNTPSFPASRDSAIKRLTRSTQPRSWYFGTATVEEDIEGKLFNRKSQFTGLHVVVLDDIGTKVDIKSLPEELVPNYIIESSEGNYQYGFVLDTPIRDLAQAEALIHIVYTSGFSDEGGKLATKVVRLPCGHNGKPTDQGSFNVRLVESNTDYWTPEELVEALNVGVTWTEVINDPDILTKSARTARMTGTSLWSPVPINNPSLNGVVDPLLEWLYERNEVLNDTGDWVTIRCPWEAEHTAGGGAVAGYSPIGRGGNFNNQRSFKCFHAHCEGNHINEFLEHVTQLGAPQVPVIDHVADLVADYAFITSENTACRIRGVNTPTSMKMDAFKNAYPKSSMTYELNGKLTKVADARLWLTAPNRLTLDGRIYDPSNPSRVVDDNNLKQLNTYTAPTWGKGDYDENDIKMFLEFIEYLMPDAVERDYFMQWLAAKCQNVTFKGACLLMVAPTQGTGRTTLTDMVSALFMFKNVRKVNFKTLCSASEEGKFNDWQESIIVTCDEVMSKGSERFEVYEGLKDLFDPKVKEVIINEKYGSQRAVKLYTSYIMLTNHIDAIGALGGDRRVYVISNTLTRAPASYFTKLNEWLDDKDGQGKPKWAESVWRYMQTLPADLELLNGVAPETEGKRGMIEATGSIVDAMVYTISHYMGDMVCPSIAKDLAEDILYVKTPATADKLLLSFDKVFKQVSQVPSSSVNSLAKIQGKARRMKLNKAYIIKHGIASAKDVEGRVFTDLMESAKSRMSHILDNTPEVVKELCSILDSQGY